MFAYAKARKKKKIARNSLYVFRQQGHVLYF